MPLEIIVRAATVIAVVHCERPLSSELAQRLVISPEPAGFGHFAVSPLADLRGGHPHGALIYFKRLDSQTRTGYREQLTEV